MMDFTRFKEQHGVGFARKPPRWLTPGDEVAVEVEGIGRLVNPVVAEA